VKVGVVGGRTGVIVDGHFVDAEQASDGRISSDPSDMFGSWGDLRDLAQRMTGADAHPPVDPTRLELPLPTPRQSFGVGVNYSEHAAEAAMDLPPVPMVFIKLPTSIVGPNEDVRIDSDTVDWEAELVVVIGQDCRDVTAADAWSVIAGLTIGQDISDRAIQFEGGANPQFGLGKSAPGFGPIGPWIVSADEFDPKLELDIRCELNGVIKQDSNTRHLIFGIPAIIEYLSARVQLLAGDVIFTGTPSGVGWGRSPKEYLSVGDVLETTIGQIGSISTKLVKR
jgi:2,4-diketo-3-deoxy-L-fuconate hydrolase